MRSILKMTGRVPSLQQAIIIVRLLKKTWKDLERHVYVTTVKVGKADGVNEALLVTLLRGNTIHYAACAHEGLISQHVAQKAVALVAERIAKLPPVSKQ